MTPKPGLAHTYTVLIADANRIKMAVFVKADFYVMVVLFA